MTPFGRLPSYCATVLPIAGVLVGLLLAGCSVSAQDGPDRISLNALKQSGPTSPVTLSPVTEPTTVCFVQHGHLVWVNRDIPYGSELTGTLAALAQGPTGVEALEGIRSALPAGTSGLVAQVQGDTAMVGVPKGFDDLAANEQILAVAQLTYAVTVISGITALQLTVNGEPVSMPVANGGHGGLVPGPVTRANFLGVSPR